MVLPIIIINDVDIVYGVLKHKGCTKRLFVN